MVMLRVLGAALAALVAGAIAERARADEVFVCERGRLVRATPGTLEDLKRTDPCVARYFSGTAASRTAPVERSAAMSDALSPTTASVAAGTSADTAATIGHIVDAEAAPARPPSDHRHVRLLNPVPGGPAYFRLSH